jgi:hypothetical protein
VSYLAGSPLYYSIVTSNLIIRSSLSHGHTSHLLLIASMSATRHPSPGYNFVEIQCTLLGRACVVVAP